MRHIDLDQMGAFVCQLREEERSAGTVEKYQRDVGAFAAWLAERPVSRGGGICLERTPGNAGLCAGHCELHAGGPQPFFFSICGLA